MPLNFEWDAEKAASNHAKHRLSFDDAMQIFHDVDVVTFPTVRVDDGEERFKAVGKVDDRIFTAVYALRGETIRLISARRANANEEKAYEHRA